jgi:hypothetical protein
MHASLTINRGHPKGIVVFKRFFDLVASNGTGRDDR